LTPGTLNRNSDTPPTTGDQGAVGITRDRWTGDITSGASPQWVQSADGGRGGYRRVGKDAQGNNVYFNLSTNDRTKLEGGKYSWDNENAERARLTDQGERTTLQERSDKAERTRNDQWNKEHGLRLAELERNVQRLLAEIRQIQQNVAFQTAQLGEVTAARKEGNEINRDELGLDRDIASNQLTLGLAQIEQGNKQLEASNKLNASKLLLDDQHFQQQMELDKRNSRRTQVLGALSLIAKSAANL